MKVEISNGELIDKITILSIKLSYISDKLKIKNIEKEYKCLIRYLSNINIDENSDLYCKLYAVNKKLWDIEDNIRNKENKKEFDEEFITLARQVYITNDKRCKIKKQINIETKSDFIEEKSYKEYQK